MKRKWHILVLAALMAIATACSGGTGSGGAGGSSASESPSGGSAPSGGSSGGEQVELRIMWWGDQKRADITNEALKVFQQKHPNIKVVGEFAPSTGYFDKLNTQLASGTAPDVFFLGGNVVEIGRAHV